MSFRFNYSGDNSAANNFELSHGQSLDFSQGDSLKLTNPDDIAEMVPQGHDVLVLTKDGSSYLLKNFLLAEKTELELPNGTSINAGNFLEWQRASSEEQITDGPRAIKFELEEASGNVALQSVTLLSIISALSQNTSAFDGFEINADGSENQSLRNYFQSLSLAALGAQDSEHEQARLAELSAVEEQNKLYASSSSQALADESDAQKHVTVGSEGKELRLTTIDISDEVLVSEFVEIARHRVNAVVLDGNGDVVDSETVVDEETGKVEVIVEIDESNAGEQVEIEIVVTDPSDDDKLIDRSELTAVLPDPFNDENVTLSLSNSNVLENEAGYNIGLLDAIGAENEIEGPFSFSIVSDESGLFEIEGSTLKLKNGTAIDFENAAETYSLTVRIENEEGTRLERTITLRPSDANDAPEISNIQLSGGEDNAVPFERETFEQAFSDVDGDDTLESVRIDSLPGNGTLTISGEPVALGQIVPIAEVSNLAFQPNEDWNGHTDFQWSGFDGTDWPSKAATASIDIESINDEPVATFSIAAQTANEDAAFSFKLPEGLFADSDSGDSFVLSADIPKWLSFDPEAGLISGIPSYQNIGEHRIQITATDSSGAKTSTNFTLEIENVNDRPTFTQIQDVSIGEYDSIDIDAGSHFSDEDGEFGDSLTFSASLSDGSELPDWVSIDEATGKLNGTPPQGEDSDIEIRVTATDEAGESVSNTFALHVGNQNDAPELESPITDQNTDEDSEFSFNVASNFKDSDLADELTYTATLPDGSDLPDWLEFDAATGQFSGVPTNDDVGMLTIQVTASDGEKSADDFFAIMVDNTNDKPGATALVDQTVEEDSGFSLDVSHTFSDIDVGDTLTYSATQMNGSELPDWLAFDESTGIFSGTPENEDVGSLSILIVASDGSENANAIFSIEVENTNDGPVATFIPEQTAKEDAPFLFDVSDAFSDVDSGDELTYSATLADGSELPEWLSIHPLTGELSGKPENAHVGEVHVKIHAKDGVESVSANLRITIENTNDGPVVSAGIEDITTSEDAGFELDVSSNFGDPDFFDTLEFSAFQEDNSPLPEWLSFDPFTATFSGTPTNSDVGPLSIRVIASDGESSISDLFTVEVKNTNDGPLVISDFLPVDAEEDSSFSLDAAAHFEDIDSADSLTYAATLSDGSALPSWISIDSITGELSGVPGNEDVGSISVTVTATDESGATASGSFSIAVENTNDGPIASAISEQSIYEDAAFSLDVSGNFADVDASDTLSYSATLENGDPLPNWLSIDSITGELSGTPANGDVGQLSIRVTASDGEATANSVFLIEVENTNDGPVASIITDQISSEDSAFTLDVSGSFSEIDSGDELVFEATLENGDPLPSWLSFNEETGQFSGTPTNEDVGNISVTVTASDGEALASSTFGIQVDNTNDGPTATAIADQTTDEDAAFSLDVSGNFADIDAGDILSYSATLQDGSALPSWLSFDEETGKFSGTPTNGDVGEISLSVTATDGEGVAESSFSIQVTNTNDGPIATTIEDQASQEDSEFNFNVSENFSDVDVGDELSFEATLSGGSPLPAWLTFDKTTGQFSGTPDTNNVGTLNIKVTASDGEQTAEQTFSISVAKTNDLITAVVDTDSDTNTIAENAAEGTTVGVVASATDADVGDSITYAVNDSRFTVNSDGTVKVASGASFDAETESSIDIVVTATSTDGSTSNETFSIAVRDIDEADVSATTDTDTDANTIAENATEGTTVGITANATDADATNSEVSYSVDDARFTVDSNGVVKVAAGASFDTETEPSIDIVVTSTSQDGSTSNETFTIAVSDIDEADVSATTDTDTDTNTIAENATEGTTVGITASATDSDATNSDVSYSVDDARFTVDENGVVKVAVGASFDTETEPSIDIVVTSTSSDGSTSNEIFTVNVSDVDEFDVSAVTDAQADANTIAENASEGTTVGVTAAASDADATDTVTYSVDDARFTVETNGTVKVAAGASFDAETESSIDIVVTATSSDGSTSNETFTIAVSDVDEFDVSAISDSDENANAISENVSNGEAVGITASASDADAKNDTITYSISNDPSGTFAIDPITGVVTVDDSSGINYESEQSHTIEITATSADGSTAVESFSVAVTNINEAPTVTPIADQTTDEDAAFSLSTASSFDDVDFGDSLSYSATLANGTALPDWLSINSTTGVLSGTPENGDVGSASITVTATDSAGANASSTFSIQVENTNDGPVASSISDQTAIEDSAFSLDTSNNFNDADIGDTITYTATTENAQPLPSWLTIDSATGVLSGTPANDDVGQISIKVTATDAVGASASDTFSVTVENTNDGPQVNAAVKSLWSEDFDDLADGIQQGDSWSTDDTSASIQGNHGVTNGEYAFSQATDSANDTSSKIVFTSDPINLSEQTNVTFRFDIKTVGEMQSSGDWQDHFSLFATVQGHKFEFFEHNGSIATDPDGYQTISLTSATYGVGEVTLSFEAKTTSAAESFIIDNIALDGTGIGLTRETVLEDEAFSIDASVNFSDVDANDSLNFAATLADGSSLPDWLTIDTATGVISGTPENENVGTISLKVTATDSAGASATDTFSLVVENTNDGPVATLDTASASEDGITISGNLLTNDSDPDAKDSITVTSNSTASYGTISITENGAYTYNIDNSLASVQALGVGETLTDTITYQITDTAGASSSSTLTVTIAGTNDGISAVADTNNDANSIAENASEGTTAGVVATASDADTSDTITYTVDDARFSVDPDGTVKVASGASFDTETEASIDIVVTATSTDGSTSSKTFSINVSDVDEFDVSSTTDTDTDANSIAENATEGATVGITASASDADAGDSITYSVDDNRFTIDANGVVKVAAGASFDTETEPSIDIVVTSTSLDGSTSNETFTIAVSDIDEADVSAISDNNAGAETISEATSNGDAVGITAFASDDDATDNGVSYTLSDDANGAFTIDGSTGVVTVADATQLDYETTTSETIEVTATSADGSTSTKSYSIAVSDDNEFDVSAVTDTDATANAVNEDASQADSIGIVASASDADGSNNAVTYSVDDSRFTVDSDGTVRVAGGASFDAETEGSIDIVVTATSADGSISNETFTVAVNDVDEADVSAVTDSDAGTNTLAENATEGSTVGVTASASDSDVTDTVAYSVDDSRFTVDANGTVKVAQGASFDAETEASIEIEVTATSSDGSTSNETFTLAVSDIDESDVSAVSDTDDASNTISEFSSNGNTVGITASASDSDVTNSDVSYSLSSDPSGAFEINPTTGVVTVADASKINFETAPSHTIEVIASSADGSTSVQSFTVTVTDENEVPTVTPISNQTTDEDAAFSLDVSGNFVDVDTNDTLTYTATLEGGAALPSWLSINAATGELSGTPENDDVGSISVTVIATDSAGATASDTFGIQVVNTNDGPTATAIADQITDEDAAFSLDVSGNFSDIDAGDALTYSATLEDGSALPSWLSIDSLTGELSGSPENGDVGSLSVTVTATDSAGTTASDTFGIQVDNTNDAPIDLSIESANRMTSINEDDTNNQYLVDRAPSYFSGASEFTVEIQFSTDDLAVSGANDITTLLSYASPGESNDLLVGITAESEISVFLGGTQTTIQTPNINLTNGADHQLSVSWESETGSLNVYVDGELISTQTGFETGYSLGSDGVLVFGQEQDSLESGFVAAQNFEGKFGEIRIFNDVRTQQEIRDNSLTQLQTTDGSEQAIWQAGNIADGTWTDSSGNGHDLVSGQANGSGFHGSTVPHSVTAIDENSAGGSVVLSATGTDQDIGDSLTYSLSDDAEGKFQINSNTGEVTVTENASLDHETNSSHSITIVITDDSGASYSEHHLISITDKQEGPYVETSLSDQTTDEDASFSLDVSESFADPDAGDTLTYSATLQDGSALPSWLSIDAVTGQLSGAPENGDVGSISVTVTATDSEGATATDTLGIQVNNTNDGPTVNSTTKTIWQEDFSTYSNGDTEGARWSTDDSAAENQENHGVSEGEYSFGKSSSTAGDQGSKVILRSDPINISEHSELQLTFDLKSEGAMESSGDWRDYFVLKVTSNGQTATLVDQNGSISGDGSTTISLSSNTFGAGEIVISFEARTTDATEFFSIDNIQLDGEGVGLTSEYVSEDSQFTLDASANFEDVDAGDTLTFSATLANGDPLPDWMEIDTATGEITGTPSNDQVDEISLQVTATDSTGATATDTFVLIVENTNDGPTATMISDQTIDEDAAFSLDVSANFADEDASDTLTFSATLEDGSALPSWLSIDSVTGELSGTPENGDVGSISVTVTATDSAGSTAADTFDIQVDNTNDNPTGISLSEMPSETLSANVTNDSISIGDGGGEVTSVVDLSDSTNGNREIVLELNTVDNSLKLEINGQAISEKTIQLQSNVFDSSSQSMLKFEDGSTLSNSWVANENGLARIKVVITDGQLQVLGTRSKTSTSYEELSLEGAVFNTPSLIDGDNELVLTNLDDDGADGLSASVSATYSTTPPAISTGGNGDIVANVLENEPGILIAQLSSTDPDADDTANYSIANDTSGFFEIENGILKLKDAAFLDAESQSSHEVTLQVTDSAGVTYQETITINVTNVYEGPESIGLSDQTIDEDSTFSLDASESFSDADAEGSLTYSATLESGAPLPDWLSIDSQTGELSGTPENGDVGSISVSVTASDEAGSTASSTIGIQVNNTNDGPVATPIADQSATEDSEFTFTVPENTFIDEDAGDSLTYIATLADGSLLPDWLSFDAQSGTFSGTPDNADVGTISLKVTATDESGASVSETFDVTTANTNDGPIQAFQESSGLVSIEAENYHQKTDRGEDTWDDHSGSFDGVYMASGDADLLQETGAEASSEISYVVNFDTPGTYYVWVKADATVDGGDWGSDDSLHIGLNNEQVTGAGGITGFTEGSNGWGNSETGSSARVAITVTEPGEHTINIWAREDGVAIDKLVLTTDANYSPSAFNSGNGPDESARAGELADQTADSASFSYTVESDVFSDVDAGDSLSYSASLSDGSPLPTWLTFDPGTMTFSGDPSGEASSTIEVKLTASDGTTTASDTFSMEVVSKDPDENITGTWSDDNITTGSGNDTIDVLGGNNYVDAGDGNNTVYGGDGSDVIITGSGDDTIDTGWGEDQVNSGGGDDTVTTQMINHADQYHLGDGYDSLILEASNQHLDFTAIDTSKLSNIEQFNIGGSGSNSIRLSAEDVLDLTDENNSLFINGDSDDSVEYDESYLSQGTETINGVDYNHLYDSISNTHLYIDTDITDTPTF
ncbi:putative Ig domain-containing protein [Pelagicoccus sp. SDUM812002]|uniref:putative Ig domain-containing protein n=1 Tax=Pelagicoccus sp. SDUM812002 TaxID=3041266 RepID=UPI00280C5BE5|nr:putative Ig domain-containing protein [Pelagicoccus sp. SDUM812002]MDQ8186653.1 putative Ig domain-containing protein [Pelagicoccus sp. SDUM812002]